MMNMTASCPAVLSFHHIGDAARAARDRVALLAPWVYEASNPFADWYFGDPGAAAEIVAEWMLRPTSELYLGRGLLAEHAGAPVGLLLAIGGAELLRCRMADFGAFCQDLGEGPEAESVLTEVIAASRALFAPVREDELYISRVVVDPRWRGRGFGRQLLLQALDLHRAAGYRRARLDVCAANVAARRLYESVGMRTGSISRSAEAGMAYCAMVMDL